MTETSNIPAKTSAPTQRSGTLIMQRLFPTVMLSRCPNCAQGNAFKNYFSLHQTCSVCNAQLERESGSFLIAYALNYFVTAIITAAVAVLIIVRFGFFPALTPILIAVGCTAALLFYKPIKALYLWIMWAFGFVYPD